MAAPDSFTLRPGQRILYLTKDPELIRKQLAKEVTLTMSELSVESLLDNINTDAMTPAWVCFDYDPREIAKNAYAGLLSEGRRIFPENALLQGDFAVIVSGQQKGVGSSRETAAQAEVYSGSKLAIAASFAPIHARNNINIGQLMAGHDILSRIEAGEEIPLAEFTRGHRGLSKEIIKCGGLLPFCAALVAKTIEVKPPNTEKRPMTMAEKLLARHLVPGQGNYLKPGDSVLVRVDGGYSHEFTSAQVHFFLEEHYGSDYQIKNPDKFAVFEDHLIYADGVPRMAPFSAKIEQLRGMQRKFQAHTGVCNFSAREGKSPGICHQVAREHIIEPGDFIQATDSHTCMGGASGALAWGVGATEYAALLYWGFTPVSVPESIRFELVGRLASGVTAKDLILHILATYARREDTLDRMMEWGGEGLWSLSPDERATLANMATECSARGALMEVDDTMLQWMAQFRPGISIDALREKVVTPDPGAEYAGGVHKIELSTIAPMVATPGQPELGIASDPKNGELVADLPEVAIDIAYGGSCTAGKRDDIDFYARVVREARDCGRFIAEGVTFYLQFGSEDVAKYAQERGYLQLFQEMGVKVIRPGCGACIGCGPGVSDHSGQVTISAINRNYTGRSGPGKLYLASPLTVAASAITGRITAYHEGMFG